MVFLRLDGCHFHDITQRNMPRFRMRFRVAPLARIKFTQ